MSERVIRASDPKTGWVRIGDMQGPLVEIAFKIPSTDKVQFLNYDESEIEEIRDAITAVLKSRRARLKRLAKELPEGVK